MLAAGAASVDITPSDAQFLYGYPHVARYSTGVHDPLFSAAVYLDDGDTAVMFVANDIIWLTKASVARVRERIADVTGVPPDHILVSATHTHSAPITHRLLSNEADAAVPEPDPSYVQQVEHAIVAAATQAQDSAVRARVGLAIADGRALGGNRRAPDGPRDSEVPVLAVKRADRDAYIAAMLVCSMHPTVLHEDSTLISGDFPGLARQYLQQHVLGAGCPVIHHLGAAGNQSPRHVTQANTFSEAQRLGELLGQAVARALENVAYREDLRIMCRQTLVDLPVRDFGAVETARQRRDVALQCLEDLRSGDAPRVQVRTAEVDWFGAEEALVLAEAAAAGRVAGVAAECLPAEVQLISLGSWAFVGWPAEVFVEYALALKARCADTFLITLANGEAQGYLVTAEAAAEGGYEASNALFDGPEAGRRLLEATVALWQQRGQD